jgi:hypothetical protein
MSFGHKPLNLVSDTFKGLITFVPVNKRYIISLNRLFCAALLLAFFSCAPQKPLTTTQEEITDKIVFMMFNIRHDSVRQKSIVTLLEQKPVAGTIKEKPQDEHRPDNYLLAEVCRDTTVLQTIILEHPLYKQVEFINGEQQFAKKEVMLPQAEFFLRLQLRGRGLELRVSEVLHKKEKTQLNIFKLQ